MLINDKSKFKIQQSKRKDSESGKSWVWSIWIDAKREFLEEISNVEYILHSTFRNRVRNISSSRDKFKLTSKGWGEFTIFIRIYFKNKDTKPLYLSHDLVLFSNEKKQQKRVFISSQIKDKYEKNILSKKLENKNYQVTTLDTIDFNVNFSEAIVESIDESDIMIVIGSEISRSQEYELFQALDSDKNIYILSEEINNKFKDVKHVNSIDSLLKDIEDKRMK